MVGAAVEKRVVEDFHSACAGTAGVRDPRNINTGECAAVILRVGHANVVDHVVIGLHRALAGVDRGKIYAVTAVAMHQIVMDMKVELTASRLVARQCSVGEGHNPGRAPCKSSPAPPDTPPVLWARPVCQNYFRHCCPCSGTP